MAFTPMAGTAGRVKSGTNTVAGITSWKRQSTAAAIPIPHFESSADVTTSTVQPNKLKGLGDNKVMIEGIYNTDATDGTEVGTPALTNGASVTLDLVVDKTGLKGYDGVSGFISEFSVTCQINNQATAFTATVEVNGVFPAYGAIS